MKKHIIFTDIDGTIFDHSTFSIPTSTINALQQLKQNGHAIFISSGRCKQQINDELLSLPVDGFILGCGTHIIYNQKDIYVQCLPKNSLKQLIDYMCKHDIGFALEGHHKTFTYSLGTDLYRKIERNKLGNISDEDADLSLAKQRIYPLDLMQEDDYEHILKFSFFTPKEKEAKVMVDHLPDGVYGYMIDDPFSDLKFGEIIPIGISKASAIDFIANYLNIDLNQTIAIGDGHNDLEMIQHAYIGIAMGNACDELKEVATFITKDINDDGFEYAMKYYRLI